MPVEQTIGVVLAGGRSQRFGSPKGLARVDGRPMVQLVADVLSACFRTVVVADGASAAYPFLELPRAVDQFPGHGPLAGLHAGLTWASGAGAEGIACAPCDAPLVTPMLFASLVEQTGGFDAVVPATGPRGIQPLFAWYSTRLLTRLESLLRDGRLEVRAFVGGIDSIRFVTGEELKRAGIGDEVFSNVNTPADLDRVDLHLDSGGW